MIRQGLAVLTLTVVIVGVLATQNSEWQPEATTTTELTTTTIQETTSTGDPPASTTFPPVTVTVTLPEVTHPTVTLPTVPDVTVTLPEDD